MSPLEGQGQGQSQGEWRDRTEAVEAGDDEPLGGGDEAHHADHREAA
jgi:hypothetical protein